MIPFTSSPAESSTPSSLGVEEAGFLQRLPTRNSCEQCRLKKLKCDGIPAEGGGCARCRKIGVQCKYVVRAPIGRPKGALGSKKRKSDSMDRYHPPEASTSHDHRRSLLSSVGSEDTGSFNPNEALVSNNEYASNGSTFSHSAGPKPMEKGLERSEPGSNGDGFRQSLLVVSDPPISTLPQYSLPAANQYTYTNARAPTNPIGSTSRLDSNCFNESNSLTSALASLEMAAFLDSLGRVEIRKSDGLTENMLPDFSSDGSLQYSAPFSTLIDCPPHAEAHSTQINSYTAPRAQQLNNVWQGTILDENISYAVPSDFSWWSFGLDPSTMNASSSTVPASTTAPSMNTLASDHPSVLSEASHSMPLEYQSRSEWPRGSESGMGSGQLRTRDGEVVSGGPWPEKIEEETTRKSCCCSKKAAASEALGQGTSMSPHPNSLSESSDLPPRDSHSSLITKAEVAEAHNSFPRRHNDSKVQTHASKTSKSSAQLDNQANTPHTSSEGTSPSHASDSSPRVFCVPNPSGQGCTCLCDSDVCLIRLRRTLRNGSEDGCGGTKGKDQGASLSLTLSASQAVSASCACSSSCPTCRSIPSISTSNAVLLFSLSLQIYARAVRVLRDGLGVDDDGSGTAGLEIRIGGYRPRKENARKIALLAMKLELTDLQTALDRVWKMASGSSAESASTFASQPASSSSDVADDSSQSSTLSPIDRLVIGKMREQLREMVSRVEALERT